ncbi:hypothetical protein HX786_11900 [Pseudomonas sp. 21615526]|uniref:hypothetical protein n=1 Tax=Pseudomonas sp. 21615526 TaxID=2738811 RepID=UPI0015C1982D|nr:hypothetical protein [Pseudomonas sp. 21615526]NVZ38782.1 hypothetical protein [Pseudomonas sp. 21615526]
MTRHVGVDYWYLRYMASSVRTAETKDELLRAEHFFVGYLAASADFKAIKSAERDRLFVLLNNARKLRTKELDAFQKKQKPARVPGPWTKASS